ncbi:ferritin-like domain-containing protein [Rhodovibrionaceae bacterium A322]
MTLPHSVSQDKRLFALQENSQSQQWSATEDIDWSLAPKRPKWLVGRFHTLLISQFRHGEQVTVELCKKLLQTVEDPAVQTLLRQQIADEERHALTYDRYLGRLGGNGTVDPAMAAALEQMLSWKGSPLGLMVAVQILLEGEALRTLQGWSRRISCPLFQQINTKIMRDEARHVAFGKVYLSQELAKLEEEEHQEIYRFVKDLWDQSAAGMFSQLHLPGIVTNRLRAGWTRNGWQKHVRSLEDIGLTMRN